MLIMLVEMLWVSDWRLEFYWPQGWCKIFKPWRLGDERTGSSGLEHLDVELSSECSWYLYISALHTVCNESWVGPGNEARWDLGMRLVYRAFRACSARATTHEVQWWA